MFSDVITDFENNGIAALLCVRFRAVNFRLRIKMFLILNHDNILFLLIKLRLCRIYFYLNERHFYFYFATVFR